MLNASILMIGDGKCWKKNDRCVINYTYTFIIVLSTLGVTILKSCRSFIKTETFDVDFPSQQIIHFDYFVFLIFLFSDFLSTISM